MKKIKIILAILSLFILNIFISNATYDVNSLNNGYNDPIIDGSIEFKAELNDGKVNISWTKYNKDESFKYYKIIRSQKISSPIYPDDGYIKYSSDINFTEYVDYKAPIGTNYYRVCAITDKKNRYCSNVVKIVTSSSVLKENPTICTLRYAPVCGEKKGLKKTYGNKCMLKGADAKYLYNGKCKINSEINEKLRKKADYLVIKFIRKIENKYSDTNDRIKVLNTIIKKLNSLGEQKPKVKNLTSYINKKFNNKLSSYIPEIKDIEEIFDEY